MDDLDAMLKTFETPPHVTYMIEHQGWPQRLEIDRKLSLTQREEVLRDALHKKQLEIVCIDHKMGTIEVKQKVEDANKACLIS